MKKRMLGLLSAAALALTSIPVYTASAADQRDAFEKDGYSCELWNQDYQGTATWTVGDKGTYSCEWNGIKNVLFRTGKKFSDYPQWDSLNGITLDYEASVYEPDGNSYLCVYGWTKNPLVEYYIVENYGSWRPPGVSDTMKMVGEITVDGGTYEVYKGKHQGPSIETGVNEFDQYWSVRKQEDLRSKGSIDIAAHFKAWEEKFGMTMGGMYEVALNVEGYMSNGKAVISKNNLVLGNGETAEVTEPEPTPAETKVQFTTPSGSGTGVTDDFEGSGTDWTGRGDVGYGFVTDFVHGGKQALYVTDRTGAWHGLSVPGGTDLEAGESYRISAFTGYQNDTYSTLGFTLGIQYDLDNKTHYDNLVDAEASSGKWTELAADFDVPAGASAISLYVQTAYTESPTAADLLSFYFDDVVLTKGSSEETEETTAATEETTTTPEETTTVADETTTAAEETTAPETTAESNTVTTTEATETTPVETNALTETTEAETDPAEPASDVKATMLGDANCDDSVDVSDAVLVARYTAADSVVITEVGKKNADCNHSGKPDQDDILLILRFIAKLIQF